MQLSKQSIAKINRKEGLELPVESMFDLPEKVLQFGTGVLLRGLPDYFIDKANRQGLFNGRIVVVKSTSTGGADAFDRQDGLYTLCIRGIENGTSVDHSIVNASISRVLSAAEHWPTILGCAHNADMKLIISNTTEAGIVLEEDSVHSNPPHSFPGKILAFLYERFKAFRGSRESGMIIIPTELLVNNGDKLRSIVLELAAMNKLGDDFLQWLNTANEFCNSLVDRIVPGKLLGAEREAKEKALGYTDELMIMAESFRLWAIESGSGNVKELLSFAGADKGVVIADDIEKFRELKLRLLNGTHTFSCGLAYLAGFDTVKAAMSDERFSSFIRRLSIREIAPLVEDQSISHDEAVEYAGTVIDRFSNPFLEHQWISITLQYTLKMKMRNVPLLQRHYSRSSTVPACMALGFAAYILFMRSEATPADKYEGDHLGKKYLVQDDAAAWFAAEWKRGDTAGVVKATLSNLQFWDVDLGAYPGFESAVRENLSSLVHAGVMATLEKFTAQKESI